MDRRRALKLLGGSLVAMTGAGVCARQLLPPSPSARLASADELAAALVASFDDETRAVACVPLDAPARQLHNRGLPAAGAWVMSLADEQRQLVVDLLHAGLSEQGRARVPHEYFTSLPGVHAMKVLVCTGGPWVPGASQAVITGPHLNLRIGALLGGVQVYGDQRGNEQPGIPGNLYRDQLAMGQALFASLSDAQRAAALGDGKLPPQTQVVPVGASRGVEVAALGAEARASAKALVGAMLSNYPRDDVRAAWAALDERGGVDALRVSFAHDFHGDAVHFRFEGDRAVLHFQGDPHVHAYANVWRDAPLSLGPVVAENPLPLEGAAVASLFERAMKAATGADRAFFEVDDVPSGLRAGTIREGDVWAIECFGNRVAVAETDAGTVAACDYAFEDGLVDGVRAVRTTDTLLRDATIKYARANGFG